MNRGIVTMSQKELQRLPVLKAVLQKQTTQVEAARCLDLSPRQVRRLQGRLEIQGPEGLAHRNRGCPSNHAKLLKLRRQVFGLIREWYADFGPTLASEKLAERHGILLSDETVRRWMRTEGIQSGRRRSRPHRQWRQRSACVGAMVQMDGSHHRWLEGRGGEFVLMGYVDDATGRVYARFYLSEDRASALDSFGRYCRRYGIPQSVYLDRHSIYQSQGKPTVEDQLANRRPQTQFERALSELGTAVLHAHSPQAKGRVERLFKTFQDRLVKEMRLAGIRSLGDANRFLTGFLMRYNRRFSKAARQEGDLHRPAAGGVLARALCVKEPRVVANDGTIQMGRQRLQLLPPGLRPLAKRSVVVTIRPGNQRVGVFHEGRPVPYRTLPASPPKPQDAPEPTLPRVPRRGPPAPDHPWRQFEKVQRRKKTLQLLRLHKLQGLETLKT